MTQTTTRSKPQTALKELRPLGKFLRPYRRRLTLGIIYQVLSVILSMISPWLVKAAIDGLTTHKPFAFIRNQALMILGITIVQGVFLFLMRWYIITVSRYAEYDLRNALFLHLASLPRSFYHCYATGDLMSRLTNDLNAVRMVLGPAILQGSNTIFYLIFAFSMMIAMQPKLTFIAIIPLPFLPLFIYRLSSVIRKRSERVQEGLADINTCAQENLSGMRVVKSYHLQADQMQRFNGLSDRYLDMNMELAKVQGLFFPAMMSISGLAVVIVLFAGGRLVMNGSITIGTLVAFLSYLTMLTWPLFAVGWVIIMIQRGAASMRRINNIFHEQPSPEPETSRAPDLGADPVVTMDGVWFRYSEDRDWVLRDLNLVINRGEVLALMGMTGSGKTTLAQLLSKSFLPTKGSITMFGVPIERLSTGQLRTQLGVAPQDMMLFSASIEENITFGVDEPDLEKMDQAAAVARFKEEIDCFPHGYQTLLGERGINLSGGQKQRLSLARALLSDPELLILDDPFSSVDIATEEAILQEFDAIRSGGKRTVIIISHRVNTARRADRIAILDQGVIAETGTHAELIARGGLYCELYRRQQLEEELARL